MPYPAVQITNSTNYVVIGAVTYASDFCGNDFNEVVQPLTTWTASGRGICLVTKVAAGVDTPNGHVAATSYTSSGTSYSQFAVIQTGADSYSVARIVTGSEDIKPADYVEPTEKQK